jgi:chromosome segregation ATPase
MNYTESADRIKQIAFYYQGVLELADALAEAGSLEATLAGLKAQREASQQQLEALQGEVAHATAQCDAAKIAAESVVHEADRRAAEIVDAATQAAAQMAEQAQINADRILETERESRERTLHTVTQAVLSAQASLADLQAQATHAMGAQQEAMTRLTETQAELDAIQSRARKLVGEN